MSFIDKMIIARVEKMLNNLEILVGEIVDKEIQKQGSNKVLKLMEKGKIDKSDQRKLLIINFQIIILKSLI